MIWKGIRLSVLILSLLQGEDLQRVGCGCPQTQRGLENVIDVYAGSIAPCEQSDQISLPEINMYVSIEDNRNVSQP